MRESDRSTGSKGRGIGILVCVGKKGNIPSFDEGSPNGAPGKRMPGGLRVVFRGASARKPIRLLVTRSLPSLRANLTRNGPEHRFNVRRNSGDRSSRAWSNGVGRTVLFYREEGKAEYSAGVGWEQEGKRILFDIAGEAVEDTFEVILRMLLPFL